MEVERSLDRLLLSRHCLRGLIWHESDSAGWSFVSLHSIWNYGITRMEIDAISYTASKFKIFHFCWIYQFRFHIKALSVFDGIFNLNERTFALNNKSMSVSQCMNAFFQIVRNLEKSLKLRMRRNKLASYCLIRLRRNGLQTVHNNLVSPLISDTIVCNVVWIVCAYNLHWRLSWLRGTQNWTSHADKPDPASYSQAVILQASVGWHCHGRPSALWLHQHSALHHLEQHLVPSNL